LIDRGIKVSIPPYLLTDPTVHNVQPKAIADEAWQVVWYHRGLQIDERVALGLGFFCGLRRAEVVSLTRNPIDSGTERIVNFARKGGLEDVFHLQAALVMFETRLPHLVSGTASSFLEPSSSSRSSRPQVVLGPQDSAVPVLPTDQLGFAPWELFPYGVHRGVSPGIVHRHLAILRLVSSNQDRLPFSQQPGDPEGHQSGDFTGDPVLAGPATR
jgi:hypothetical protein